MVAATAGGGDTAGDAARHVHATASAATEIQETVVLK